MKHLRRIPFTKEGFDKIESEYDIIKVSRPEAVETLRRARDLGDLSENGLYKAARAQLSSIDSRLSRLEILIKLAEVQEAKPGIIGVGSRVSLREENNEITYIIVGEYEANPKEKKISTASPIGRALVGKKVGDTVKVSLPTKKIKLTIKSIG